MRAEPGYKLVIMSLEILRLQIIRKIIKYHILHGSLCIGISVHCTLYSTTSIYGLYIL